MNILESGLFFRLDASNVLTKNIASIKAFKKSGYKVPKFLLKINNRYIIEHVINLFPGEKNFLFICNKKHLSSKQFNLTRILKKICPRGFLWKVYQSNQ